MACFSAETGTLAFAILNLILVTLSTASSLLVLIFWVVAAVTISKEINGYKLHMMFRDLAIIIIWMTGSLLSLVFGSFLLHGSLKKKPEHIKAYYVFGIVKICLFLLGLAIAFAAVGLYFDVPFCVSILLILTAYGTILHMLHRTYTKLENANEQFAHQFLNEKC